jgi:hypothetical protein
MTTPGSTPGYGNVAGARETGAFSGTQSGMDPTFEKGNYAGSLFGVPLPQGTGAPGSPGAVAGTGDPTNEPGQTALPVTGQGPDVIASTGAPGSAGQQNHGGGADSVHYTRPGSYLSGTYVQDMVQDSVSGTDDWTQANDGSYAGPGQQLPGVSGNEPTSTGAGQGRVVRGGRGGA